MGGDDVVNNGKPETRAVSVGLRREKRFKDSGKGRWGNAGAIVPYFHDNFAVWRGAIDRKLKNATGRAHRVCRIREQIDENLDQLLSDSVDRGQILGEAFQ